MQGITLLLPLLLPFTVLPHAPEDNGTMQEDTVQTSEGDLIITFIGHGTLMFRHRGTVIHVDPVGRDADSPARGQ